MPLQAIGVDEMEKIGVGIQRPEDVVVSADGRVWAADQQSACAEILPDGSLRRIGDAGGAPNGINMDLQGRILIANFGMFVDEPGPLQRLDVETGEVETLVAEIDGVELTSANYPILDRRGNLWCSHSTSATTMATVLDNRADGFLFRVTPSGAVETLATGLEFANGLALNADESAIYVCQSEGCNVVRYPLNEDGSVGNGSQYGPSLGERLPEDFSFEEGLLPEVAATIGLPDGCGFDEEGNLWVTLPIANKLVAITPDGSLETIAHDPSGETLSVPTNVSWGGDDMRDLYVGSIATNYVLKMRSPVPGMPLIHQR